MKGGEVQHHWNILLEPREARALLLVLQDAREQNLVGQFALNELEDETLASLIDILGAEKASA